MESVLAACRVFLPGDMPCSITLKFTLDKISVNFLVDSEEEGEYNPKKNDPKTGEKIIMMTTRQLQDEILRLKKEKDICILAHAYQSQEILEVADYTGDSYGLSQQAAKAPQKNVLMCGVRFMAETVKILSPEKTVYLSNSGAGCPMAEQLDLEGLRKLKAEYPDHAVVAYINTTSELKTECDVCVTSSSAVQICSKLENDKILLSRTRTSDAS